jgi:hexosaminidase
MAGIDDSILLLPAPRKMERLCGSSRASVEERIDPTVARAQGYQLSIRAENCRLVGHDAAGIFYGRQTLAQLRRQFGNSLPCLEITDWPDFPHRGVMLDISRDKVPTMATLYSLIDRLAEWKINQLQLYIENTFAYRGHEEVWQNASPMTADEIRELDRCCAQHFIELVPNQNSFGHMERWLKFPKYLPLAEAPDGSETPWGFRWKGPFSLCPTDPRSFALLEDLYSQLLPNFTSKMFNVGCDETFDIGQGRSKQECDRRGVHEVYLDFLSGVNELALRHGRRMMFWGDIVLKESKIISRLPKDAIALDWGYEADHPFDSEAKCFAESGLEFYVCPGTSSWCSIAGRTDNMLANQLAAAEAGLKHGAAGFLNTDWGDYGHLQYLPISFPGLAAGAAMSWCLDTNRDLPLARLLDLHVFEDSAGIMGAAALELGNVYKKATAKPIHNRSALFSILVPSSTHHDPMDPITAEGLEASLTAIDSATRHLDRAKMNRPDVALILSEFKNATNMLRLACARGRWKLDPSSQNRRVLALYLAGIPTEHRRCWLARNRAGGLEDSISRLAPL